MGDDAYAFARAEPITAICAICHGDGEHPDFPPDDDERMIACATCEGTGEVIR